MNNMETTKYVIFTKRFACRNHEHLLYAPFAIFIVSLGKHAPSRDAIYLFIFTGTWSAEK